MKGRAGVAAAAALAIAVLFAAGRLRVEGGRERDAAADAVRRGEPAAAQVHLERAARAYFPGNGPAVLALAGLRDLSDRWERDGEVVHALSAAESLRGILVTTGAGAFHQRLREEADARVARLREALDRAGGQSAPSGDARYRLSLMRKRAPAALPGALGLLAFTAAGFFLRRLAVVWGDPGPLRGMRLGAAVVLLAAAGLALLAVA